MTKDYAVTAMVGENADLFPSVLKLYVPRGSRVLDMTYGRGLFWKRVDEDAWDLVRNDIDESRGDIHKDFRDTQLPSSSFDAVVLDPPYLYIGGFKTLNSKLDRTYQNKQRALEQGIYGVAAVHQMYKDGIAEAYRVLKHKGILITKTQDQVMSGRQVWQHMVVHDYALEAGFRSEDLFVLVSKSSPIHRHEPERQRHARRNHSYFSVFRAWKPNGD